MPNYMILRIVGEHMREDTDGGYGDVRPCTYRHPEVLEEPLPGGGVLVKLQCGMNPVCRHPLEFEIVEVGDTVEAKE